MKAFITAISFFTRIPVPFIEWDEENYKKGLYFLPLIGLIIGGLLYLLSLGLAFQPRLPKGILLYILYVYLSGGLHLDGLADSMDALMSGREREKQWEILKDPTLGSFGVLGLILASLVYVYLFETHTYALLLIPAVGRVCGMFAAYRQSHYNSQGMGKLLFDALTPWHLLIGILLTAPLSAWLLGLRSLISFAIALLLSISMRESIRKTLGGMGGDGVGMITEVASMIFGLTLLLGGAFCPLL